MRGTVSASAESAPALEFLAPAAIQALRTAISAPSGPRVAFGGHGRLGLLFQQADHAALIGLARDQNRPVLAAMQNLRVTFENQPALRFLGVVTA